MDNNIKQIFENKYDKSVNYGKILDRIEEKQTKSYFKYLRPMGILATGTLVLVLIVNSVSPMINQTKSSDSAVLEEAFNYGDSSRGLNYYSSGSDVVKDEAKIIHTSNISFETKDYEESYSTLLDLVNKYGGYILSSDVYSNEYEGTTYYSGNFTVRIPVDNYTAFMSGYDVVGNVINVSSNQDDVTDTYIDIETRIDTLRAQEKRLVELLDQAKDLDDVITIEDKLTDVRYNIESYQSSLDYYTRVTDYATVTVYLSEVINYSNNNKILRALNNTWDNFVGFLEDVAVFLIYALPFVVLIGLVAIIVVRIVKKSRNKGQNNI